MKKTAIFSVIPALALLLAVFAFAYAPGDIDNDGAVTSADARLALRLSVGLDECNEEMFAAADVDKDEEITPGDARFILRVSVGLESLHVHAYDREILQEPTCTEAGLARYTCECGDVLLRAIPAKGHNPVTDEGWPPTCEADGMTDGRHCSVCGYVISPQLPITEGRHVPKAVPDKTPTCTEDGYRDYTVCERCGATFPAQPTIPACAHGRREGPGQPATCTPDRFTAGAVCAVSGSPLGSAAPAALASRCLRASSRMLSASFSAASRISCAS